MKSRVIRIGLLRLVSTSISLCVIYPISSTNLKKFDAILFNPPAGGAYSQVKEIAKSKVKIIVGVSCNPTTFIRDAKVLIDSGYNIEWIKPIDQFPNTNHIELVAKFKLN